MSAPTSFESIGDPSPVSDGPHPRNNTSPTYPDEEPPIGSKLVGADTGHIYVEWQSDYEPYLVVHRSIPKYDTRFSGFGWNKVSHSVELRAQGYQAVVLPGAFVVHTPHAPSHDITAFRADPHYRLLELVEIEMREMLSDFGYNGVTVPMITGSALKALNEDNSEYGMPSIRKLLDAIDNYVPSIQRDLTSPFLMPIDNAFTVPGRGTVVVGTLKQGIMKKNDDAELFPIITKVEIPVFILFLIKFFISF
ncbi:Elongation factor Tu, mitochondrial [Papilio machaon]|uniref:Elongation factor Tu, mitochondrial n=1 Tax=Papilio machaon TaxID=76193 RepID=A0A0N0PEE8_PAPMA|nr:Elongation factor Tu, mitochondrial [Papilio machaon]